MITYFVLHDTEQPYDEDLVPLVEGEYPECAEFVTKNPKTKMWFDMPDLKQFPSLERH